MSAQEKVSDMSVQECVLRYDVAQLIYCADWEIRGVYNDHVNDITEHYLEDENKVVEAIIKTVREASQ